jgi:hypothetical protein
MYLLGLLSGTERKNSWTIAEQVSDLTQDGVRRLLNKPFLILHQGE